MRNKREPCAALVGSTDCDECDAELELLDEHHPLEQSVNVKILIISDDDSLNNDVALHLSSLAHRLSSELLIISSSAEPDLDKKMPQNVHHLGDLLGNGLQVFYLPAAGSLERILKRILNSLHNVAFAVLIGSENQRLRRHIWIPVFTL